MKNNENEYANITCPECGNEQIRIMLSERFTHAIKNIDTMLYEGYCEKCLASYQWTSKGQGSLQRKFWG
jgi:ribosomal protein S27E